jgi:hypothetical protein
VDKPTPFVACYEYPAEQIIRFTIAAGKFRLEVLERSISNTGEIDISLKTVTL